jgi:hypothetical protein
VQRKKDALLTVAVASLFPEVARSVARIGPSVKTLEEVAAMDMMMIHMSWR